MAGCASQRQLPRTIGSDFGPTVESGMGEVVVTESETPLLDAGSIAKTLNFRFTMSPTLRVRAISTDSDRILQVESLMASNRLATRIWQNGSLIAGVSAHGSHVQEFDRNGEIGNSRGPCLVEYWLREPDELPGTVCRPLIVDQSVACQIGEFTESWYVKDEASFASWMMTEIASSTVFGVERAAEGFDCVVLKQSHFVNTTAVTHTFWIRWPECELVKWETRAQGRATQSTVRTTQFTQFDRLGENDQLPWNLSIDELK